MRYYFNEKQYIEGTPDEIRQFIPVEQKQKGIIHQVILNICKTYDITKEELTSPNRNQWLVMARTDVVKTLRNEYKLSFPIIGKILKRDHTTAIHLYKRQGTKPIDKLSTLPLTGHAQVNSQS